MDFSLNRMPSTQKEIEWQWEIEILSVKKWGREYFLR